jgi:Fe-S-cluster containining protein
MESERFVDDTVKPEVVEHYHTYEGDYNPCISCGACCASFRASFYWMEGADMTPGGVPVELSEDFNDRFRIMKGTNCKTPYCIALKGLIGFEVSCMIYEQRSTSCRDFMPSYYDGVTHNERCDQAREKYNLPPIHPQDYHHDHTHKPAA